MQSSIGDYEILHTVYRRNAPCFQYKVRLRVSVHETDNLSLVLNHTCSTLYMVLAT